MTGTVLSRKLVTTDLQANQINISGPWRGYFPETPDQHFIVELDNGVEFKAAIDVTNPRLAGDGTRSAARDWYEYHRLKKGDAIYLEVIEPFRRYRLTAQQPKTGSTTSATPVQRAAKSHKITLTQTASANPALEVTQRPPAAGKISRKRGRPPKTTSNSGVSPDGRHMILDQEIKVIQDYLAGRKSHTPTSEQLCDWVRFCYVFEMYSEARDLFALVNSTEVNPWYYERTRKLATICKMKAG